MTPGRSRGFRLTQLNTTSGFSIPGVVTFLWHTCVKQDASLVPSRHFAILGDEAASAPPPRLAGRVFGPNRPDATCRIGSKLREGILMPKVLATITGALMALALLSGCGEDQSAQTPSENLDGAAEQQGEAMEGQAMEGTTESQVQEATGEQTTQ